MNYDDVKIIYCLDEQGDVIHFSEAVKGNKYFCVDCEKELIVKDGEIYRKHLAHKNTENHCGGTGESIIHKHWKVNMFKPGMFINVSKKGDPKKLVEIFKVLNEICLNDYFDKKWDRKIIVDTLLITEAGLVAVEVNYKHRKDWGALKSYYDELKLLQVFEVSIDKDVTKPFKWFTIDEYYDYQKEKDRIEQLKIQTVLLYNSGKWYNDYVMKKKVIFNYKNKPEQIDDDKYLLTCLYEYKKGQFKKIRLLFDLKIVQRQRRTISSRFDISKGIESCYVFLNKQSLDNTMTYEVTDFGDTYEFPYDKQLYIELCNIDTIEKKIEPKQPFQLTKPMKELIDSGVFTEEDFRQFHEEENRY